MDVFHIRSGNWTILEKYIDAVIHIMRFGLYKLWEFPRRNDKKGMWQEMGVKYGSLLGKTGVLKGMMIWLVNVCV